MFEFIQIVSSIIDRLGSRMGVVEKVNEAQNLRLARPWYWQKMINVSIELIIR